MLRFRNTLMPLLLISASFCMAQVPSPTSATSTGPHLAAQSAKPEHPRTQSAEDWSVLSIRGLGLQMRPVFVVQHDVRKTYTRDLVRVSWRTGDSIELFVFTPNGVKKAPAILYLYSYPSDTDRFYDEGWALRATSDGYAAVSFVSALTGQRYKYRPMKEWFVSELQESLGTTTHDVQMILNYLDARGDIDMSRIGMFGQGSGGAIAVLAAEADPRIRALDLLNPWGDWPDWLKDSPQVPNDERPNYLKADFLDKLKTLDPVTYLPHLKLDSLRIQQISDFLPKAVIEKIDAAAPSPEDVVVYKDASAHYAALHSVGASRWLKDQLLQSASSTKLQSASAGQDKNSTLSDTAKPN